MRIQPGAAPRLQPRRHRRKEFSHHVAHEAADCGGNFSLNGLGRALVDLETRTMALAQMGQNQAEEARAGEGGVRQVPGERSRVAD